MTRPPAPITVRAEHLSALEARVLVGIATHRAKHGEGPAWHLIGKAAGWNEHRELPETLWRFKRAGLVSFTREPRSIRVPRAAVALALERLRGVAE